MICQWLMPVFWIGFNIAMFPASVVVEAPRRADRDGRGGPARALAVLGAELAGNLNMLIAAQFFAGAAWGCMLMSAVSAALAIGETGAEGKVRRPGASPRWRLRPLRGWRLLPAACRSCRNTRRCCNGRRSRAGRSPAQGCCVIARASRASRRRESRRGAIGV